MEQDAQALPKGVNSISLSFHVEVVDLERSYASHLKHTQGDICGVNINT